MVGSTPRTAGGKGTERVRAGNGLSARATVNLHGLFPERIENTAVRRGAEKSRAAIVSSEVAKTPVRAAGFLLKTGRVGSPRGTASFGSATFDG